jgi:hypothetical protein
MASSRVSQMRISREVIALSARVMMRWIGVIP